MSRTSHRDFTRAASLGAFMLVLFLGSCNSGGSSSGSSRGAAFVSADIAAGPQLALAEPTSMTVAWRSHEPVVAAVEYGTGEGDDTVVEEEAPVVEHVFRLDELEPGTSYRYRLMQDDTVVSDGHEFVTPLPGGQALSRFAVFGDSGDGSDAQFEVASRLEAVDPDFVLHTGDVAYDDGTENQVREHYLVAYAHLLDHIPFYTSLGNHDVKTKGGKPLLDALYLPTNDADGSESFYSFDRGDCHFIALNSNAKVSPGSVQHEWLNRDLARSDATWKFVYFHHPLYSSSRHGPSRRLQRGLAPLFDRYAVDVVFAGHDHVYQRSFPLVSGRVVEDDVPGDPDYADPAGTIYVVTGGGGRGLYPFRPSPLFAYGESAHHIVVVDVEGGRLTLTAVRADGKVIDRMTMNKSP